MAELSGFVASFNACKDPKHVLAIAETLGAEQVAAWLYEAHKAVDVTLLGKCLGDHHPFFKSLVQLYPGHFDFAGAGVVTALRRYLWRFRLPGESAQIERILEGFARAFFIANPRTPLNPNRGWYTRQPSGERCCIACGSTEAKARGERGWLQECQGCECVTFCTPCRKQLRVSHGHAIGGRLGYGKACVAARKHAGLLTDGRMRYIDAYGSCTVIDLQDVELTNWERVSPFLTEDAVMVLCYAIIMLTTNLHSGKVKQKMKKHEFISQNKGCNNERNFPGDFLSDVYDDIAAQELEVMK